MSILANRFPGIRAALCHDIFSALMSRRHNDANLLVLGGRVIGPDLGKEIVRVWLGTPFDGGRHRSVWLSLNKWPKRPDRQEFLLDGRPGPH